jgi:S-layer protein
MATTAQTIQSYYQTILLRTASIAEVTSWVNQVDLGGIPLTQVETSFVTCPEAQTFVSPIVQLYQTYLGRAPDAVGLSNWAHLEETGTSLAAITASFAASAESQTFFGTGAPDAAFVTKLYQSILGRVPESTAATDSWLALNMSRADMEATFRASPEARASLGVATNTFLGAVGAGITSAYGASLYTGIAGIPGTTFTLTGGGDNGAAFIGAANNDTFNASETASVVPGATIPTWTAGDAIDGSGGMDTFNVIQTLPVINPLNTSVLNIEIANITSAAGVTLNTTPWTGLTALNTTSVGTAILTAAATTNVTSTITGLTGSTTIDGGNNVILTASAIATGGTISVGGGTTAPVGTIAVTSTLAGPNTAVQSAITVKGGTVVTVTESLGNAVATTNTHGTVSVIGGTATTAVTVNQDKAATASGTVAGKVNAAVTVTDVNNGSTTKAGTITSVTANGYTFLTINDTALTTLSVANGSGNIIIDNSGLTTATNKTLGVTVDGLTGGTLDDADIYTTVNVTTTGSNSTLANVTDAALTTLTVAGTKGLTLTSTAGLSALKTVTVSGAAGVTADFSGATVTAIDTSATTGTSTVTVDASKATFTGGAGVDKVTTTAATTSKAVALGDGDDSLTLGATGIPTVAISGGNGTDTLSFDATKAAAASGSGTFAGLVTGFENLLLTGATNQTIDLAVLGIASKVTTSGGNGLTLSNLTNGGTLALTGAGTAYTIGNSAFTAGTNDVTNLTLSADASAAGTNFAATGITASGVETFAITTVDTEVTPAGAHDHVVTLLGNSAKTITVAGNNGLTLTATDTALTTVDASGIILGGFTFASGALAAVAAITGSAAGINTVDFSAATKVVTYTGGKGTDNVAVTNANNNAINLGDGTNTVTGGATGNQTITGGIGADTVTVGSGNNTVNLGEGANVFIAGSGNNAYTGGSGANTVTLGTGGNTVTLGAHTAIIADSFNVAASGSFVPVATITGLNATGADTISFLGDATAGTLKVYTPAQMTAIGAALGTGEPLTLAGAIADVYSAAVGGGGLAQHQVGAFQFQNNTYFVDHGAVATSFGAGDTLVEWTGLHTITAASNVTTGVLHLLG